MSGVDIDALAREQRRRFLADAAKEPLTKREAFAMAAMQGILSNPYYAAETGAGGSIASAAVYHADALLAELEKQP